MLLFTNINLKYQDTFISLLHEEAGIFFVTLIAIFSFNPHQSMKSWITTNRRTEIYYQVQMNLIKKRNIE